MTELLEDALRKVASLPKEEQDAIAAQIIETLQDEAAWKEKLARAPNKLARLAQEARRVVGSEFGEGRVLRIARHEQQLQIGADRVWVQHALASPFIAARRAGACLTEHSPGQPMRHSIRPFNNEGFPVILEAARRNGERHFRAGERQK